MWDNYDAIIFWNYPGYNLYDIGSSSLAIIK